MINLVVYIYPRERDKPKKLIPSPLQSQISPGQVPFPIKHQSITKSI